ncbi:MAG: 5-formyltetrahydrofolate cyclo-ligase, partial [Coprobacillus sp.]
IYVSLPNEIDTHNLITETLKTKRVCVPKIENNLMNFYEIHSLDELQPGYFDVLEPITNILILPQDIGLMITPLLAYDKRLYRVGYGKGFYDKYFSSGFNGYKLGLAFSFQYIDQIRIDQYDCCLDEIIIEDIEL